MEKGGWVRGKLCIRARSTKKPFEVSCFRDELHAWLDILAPLTSPFSLTLPLFASLSIPPSLFYGEGWGECLPPFRAIFSSRVTEVTLGSVICLGYTRRAPEMGFNRGLG